MRLSDLTRRARRKLGRRGRHEPAPPLTRTQEAFVAWVSERLGIPEAAARERLAVSQSRFRGGHGGADYRAFCDLSYDVFLPLHSDDEREIFESYAHHAEMHLLRMVAYGEFTPPERLRREIGGMTGPVILDFGCGLAQTSRALARMARDTKLVLADIPTVRKDFLLWLCRRDGLDATFLDCTRETPIPDLPRFDVAVVTEFFEHVREPVRYFDALAARAAPGALLITNVSDHRSEFMHVSPNLSRLRDHMADRGMTEIEPNGLFRFPRDG